jgi:parallel beta-helix repeat protein
MFTFSRILPVSAEGTIYIRADGSIDPPTAPISTIDNVTYTLTDNIIVPASYYDAPDIIVIERDNIVFDGNGFMFLESSDEEDAHSTGIILSGRENVTVHNIQLNSLGVGILLSESSNINISGNNIVWNFGPAVFLDSSCNNSISRNMIAHNAVDGIILADSSGNKFCHNDFVDNAGYISENSANVWDDGSSSGGNYWGGYAGVDGDGDGFGDTPYIINANNTDYYPLMSPYEYWRDPVLGDVNKDMKVDISDIDFCSSVFGSNLGDLRWNPNCDLNKDCKVNMRDIGIACVNYGRHYP